MTERAEELRRRRRESILQAAAARFLLTGVDGTGMAAIAKDAQLSIGGIYRHFPSKEDIVASLVERDLERQLDRLRLAIDAAPATPPADRLRAVVRGLVEAQIPDRETAIIGIEFCAAATRSPRLAALLEHHAEQIERRVHDALPIPDAAGVVELLVTLLDGLTLRIAVAGVTETELAKASDEIAELMLVVTGASSH